MKKRSRCRPCWRCVSGKATDLPSGGGCFASRKEERQPVPVPEFLKEHKDAIRRCKIASCRSPFSIKAWEKRIKGKMSEALMHECSGDGDCRAITRQDIFDMVERGDSSRKIFLASMLWGYNYQDGRGPWRTKQMMSAPRFGSAIQHARKFVTDNEVERAYTSLAEGEWKVPWLGPAFFTKYLYFIGDHREVKPLTLDYKIAKRLEEKCGLCIKQYARVARKDGGIKQIISPFAEGYMNYINDMHKWAEELGAEAGQVECFMFYHED